MARIPTHGATVVTPYLPRPELKNALQNLCPNTDLNDRVVELFYWRLAGIIGSWAAERDRMNSLSVARALTRISKNVRAASDVLSAHRTGVRATKDIEVVSQLKNALA